MAGALQKIRNHSIHPLALYIAHDNLSFHENIFIDFIHTTWIRQRNTPSRFISFVILGI